MNAHIIYNFLFLKLDNTDMIGGDMACQDKEKCLGNVLVPVIFKYTF